jgi:hypothetical protein
MFRGTFLVYSERREAKRAGGGEFYGAARMQNGAARGTDESGYGLAVKVKLTVCGSPRELTSISCDCVPSDSCQAVMV